MALPPKLRTLTLESLPDLPEGMEPVIEQLNEQFREVNACLTKALTREENGPGEFITRDIDVPGTLAPNSSPFPLVLAPRSNRKPVAVTVVGILDRDSDATVFVDPVWASWRVDSQGRAVVAYLTGLDANARYRVTFCVE